MAISQGLIDTYWRRYNQRRAVTGLPSSYQEQRGSMDSILDYELAMKRKESDDAFRNRQLSMQEQAQQDASRAATVSGIAQTGGLLASGMLGYKALKNQAANTDVMKQYLLGPTSQGAGSGGGILPAGAGSASGVPMANAAPYAAPGPALSYGAVGEVGGGLGSGAAIPGAAPTTSAGIGTAAVLGSAAGLYAAQYATGKAVQPWAEEHGLGTTAKGWTYAGLPGASVGLAVDAFKGLGSWASDVFGF